MIHGLLKKACFDWLFDNECWAWNNPTGSWQPDGGPRIYYGKKGSGDIIGLTGKGRFFSVEVKIAPDVQTEDQKKFQQEVERRGGIYILVYSINDLEDRRAEFV